MGKKILIVTGSDYSPSVYQAFADVKALGHKLYLLSDGSFEPQKGVFEKHFTYDLRKTKGALEYMKNQNFKFDAVTIKTSEWLTPLTALLAKQYGVIGNEPITAFNCRSKYHMRKILAQNNVPIPKFQLCKNFAEILSGMKKIGLPAVAKPIGGNASYGIFLITQETDLNDLKNKYEKSIEFLKKKAISDDVFAFDDEEMDLMGVEKKVNMVSDYLLEEYMRGSQISVDAFVQNGEITVTAIEEQIRTAPPYFYQTSAKLPYVCDKKREIEINKLLAKTIKALNISNSATHTEIMFTDEGAKIIEIGCRIGGDDLHDTILEATGVNMMFEQIMIALGEKLSQRPKILCHTTMQFFFPEKEGILKKFYIAENLEKDENVLRIEQTAKPRDHVSLPPKNFDPLGYVSVKGKNPQEAYKNLQKALKNIKIIIE